MSIMQLGTGLASGFLLACAHLAALDVNVRLYLAPCAPWRPVLLHLLRLTLVVTALTVLAAAAGGKVLLAALVGFTLGRLLWLRYRR